MRLTATREWPLLDELMRFQEEFNSLFDNRVREYPAMNVWMSDDKAVVDVELPGVQPGDVEVTVLENTLTVSGNRPTDGDDGKRTWFKRERPLGEFRRTLELPFAVEADKIAASYRNGILRITLPRAEADKPRTVPIETA